MTAQYLDGLGQRYHVLPSELVKLTPWELSFNAAVALKAESMKDKT